MTSFSYRGRNRSVPTSFLNSILLVLSLQYDPILAEIWLDEKGEKFISEVAYEPPVFITNFLTNSSSREMLNFAVARLSPVDLVKTSGWISMNSDSRDFFLELVEKRLAEEPFQIPPSMLNNLNFSLNALKIHSATGGEKGKEFHKFLETNLKKIESRGSSPTAMETEQEKTHLKSVTSLQKSAVEMGPVGEHLKSIFAGSSINNRAVRTFISRIDTENMEEIIASLSDVAKNEQVFVSQASTFGNIFKVNTSGYVTKSVLPMRR